MPKDEKRNGKRHNGEAKFKCSCGKDFTRLQALQRYIKSFDPDVDDFACKESNCDFVSTQKSNTIVHYKSEQ